MTERKGRRDGDLDIRPSGRDRPGAPRARKTKAAADAPRPRSAPPPEDDRPSRRTAKRAAPPADGAPPPARRRTRAPAREEAEAPRSARPRRHSGGGGQRRSLGRRLLVFSFKASLVLALWGGIAAAGALAYFALTLPPTAAWEVPERPPNIAIVSERGEMIANRGDTGGRAVSLDELPDHVPQAVMAIEDRRFYSHFGVDPIGLARAMAVNLSEGALVQGGSTLTQQLAKNLFLEPDRTLERKMQELVLALWLELKHSKDEILEMYLNRVYLGAGATGIDGAARRYFDKPASELSIAEAAMIAGLLKAPSRFAPTGDEGRAQRRAATVLKAMRETGFITAEEEADALANPARLVPQAVAPSGGYVADWVAGRVPDLLGTVPADVVVETTIDLGLQELAQNNLRVLLAEEGREKGVSQGAVVVMDGSGAVKALVGGDSYRTSPYNRAVSAERQPGSAFKPFVYLAALEYGLTPNSMRIDQPTRIGNWAPENYTRDYYGPTTLTTALARSLNTIAAQLAAEVGPANVAAVARRLGITADLAANASIALGTSEVTLIDLVTAYVPFSNGGLAVEPHVIRRITTVDGQVLYERRGIRPYRVVSERHVGEMNLMLSEALIAGTGQRARIKGWPAAGKTGTSQNWRDAWFVGYTAFFTAGVWLGNDDNAPTKRATGGSLPAQLWREIMAAVHEGMQVAELPGARVAEASAAGAGEAIPTDQVWASSGAGGRETASGHIIPERNQDGVGGFLRRLFGG